MSTEGTPPAGAGSSARAARRAEPAFRRRGAFLIVFAVTLGVSLGVGAYTFRYAEGLSYLSSAPSACVNCHIMRSQYDGWQKASHHAAAVCVDCHLPHDFVGKWLAKAENGYRHSKEFTAQTFAEPIFVKARGAEILQENCVRCHEPLVRELTWGAHGSNRELRCVRCHAGVGHGDAARLGGRLRASELEPSHE